jgi:hypothetical protein
MTASATNDGKKETLTFTDVTQGFSPSIEATGMSFMPGVGFIDYDNDSWIDIFAANGLGQPDMLYRNNGNGTYTNVAAAAGVANTGFTTGIAVGDLNNDGFDDLYVANMSTFGNGVNFPDGPDVIYANKGDGSFRQLGAESGISEDGFTTSVAFLDYDGDGDLDIVVGRFIDMDIFDIDANRTNPTVRSHLYRNNGDLTFTDVTEQANMGSDFLTWAVATFDYDNDGDVDVFLGHEQGPITVFKNNGNGTFTDVTETAGDLTAYGAWMGLAVGDYNNDGLQDIYASNISDLWVTRDQTLPPIVVPPPETWDNPWPTLFRNNGDGTFTDVGDEAGVKVPFEFSWGTFFTDFNNDGWQDIYMTQNLALVGVIGDAPNGAGPGRMFINQRNGKFKEVIESAGAMNTGPGGMWLDGRGAAKADINKDGLMDFYVVNTPITDPSSPTGSQPGTGKPHLFENRSRNTNNWLQLRLIGKGNSNRNAIGAKIEVQNRSGHGGPARQVATVSGGGSVYSTSERTVHFGLGKQSKVDIKLTWPDGKVQQFQKVGVNERLTLVQGCPLKIPESIVERLAKRGLPADAACNFIKR